MLDHEWKEEKTEPADSWNQGVYQTGVTGTRKSRKGLTTVLLMVVVFLLGIISALGISNLHLFRTITGRDNSRVIDANLSRDETASPLSLSADATMPASERDFLPVAQLQQTPAGIPNIPQEGGLSLQAIYEKAIPSVVSISCAYSSGSSSGTGVVLSADGYIVTNCHVVEGAAKLSVLFTDGRTLQAKLVGTDEVSDLAVLWVDAQDLIPAELGDSSSLRVGDSVVAIGDPLGISLRGTMTDGIISAINRDIYVKGRTMSLIQTNAALNSGNSGGPLLNCYGQVIGINTMKIGDYVSASGVEGLGFAIPTTTVSDVVNQLIFQGYVSGRPSLGLEGEAVTSIYQMYYRLPAGLYITEVAAGSAAEKAGIRPGDILISMDAQRITDSDSYKSTLYAYSVGDTVEIIIYRAGVQYAVTLPVEEANG